MKFVCPASEFIKTSPPDETNSPILPVNAPSKIDTLNLWWHEGERSAAENLAFDEALLAHSEQRPSLRFYQWSHHHGVAWTMGYFQRFAEMPFATESGTSETQDLDIARRWTGGGLVCHQGDYPYTLTVPADHWLAKIPATDCYRWIHQRLAASIRETSGIAATAQAVASNGKSASPARACFAEPVHWDVVITDSDAVSGHEEKIAGAAQRRSQGRLLHQGSVILPFKTKGEERDETTFRWRQNFANLLCDSAVEKGPPSDELLDHAAQLASDRYRTREWREKF